MAEQTPEQKLAAEKAAADALQATADADVAAKASQAVADAAAADQAAAKAKASAAAVTPLALNIVRATAEGRPPIQLGERRSFEPVHGRIQNPITLDWFEGKPVKVEVDAWIMVQYYNEEQKLRLNEE